MLDCIVYLMQGLYDPGNLRSSAKCVLGCSVLVQKELRDPICQGNICVVTAFVPLLLNFTFTGHGVDTIIAVVSSKPILNRTCKA